MIVNINNTVPISMSGSATLAEKNETPFESDDPRTGPIRRLWTYLSNQDHLQSIFIQHVFPTDVQQELPESDTSAAAGSFPLPDAYKIVQKDHEPIIAFACSQVNTK
ncbi:hypothetical protein COOONC_00927 [Cooperia oncophora]